MKKNKKRGGYPIGAVGQWTNDDGSFIDPKYFCKTYLLVMFLPACIWLIIFIPLLLMIGIKYNWDLPFGIYVIGFFSFVPAWILSTLLHFGEFLKAKKQIRDEKLKNTDNEKK